MTTYLFPKAERDALPESTSTHQFNANAVRQVRTLTSLAGLERIGLHIVRLTQGHESTEQHSHDNDEEFLVILSGRGVAVIGDESHEVFAGDIMAFPIGSPAHALKNPHEEDLVYVMGGERNKNDVVHYPNIERSMVKTTNRRYWTDWKDQHELPQKF